MTITRQPNRCSVIAFGGYLYSISKWLPSYVIHHTAPLWGFTQRWCQDFAPTIDRPVTLIGFSEGANAAMMVASHSPMVTRAIIHSCEDKQVTFNANCDYHFFCTLQDKTPTLDGTINTAYRANRQKMFSEMTFLDYQPFSNPTMFERNRLAPRRHIFHNVLPHLGHILTGRQHAIA